MSDFTLIKKNPTSGEITSSLTGSTGDGAGLHFDGSPGYIDIASPPDLGTKFSFEFVFKATTWTSGDYKFLLDFGGGSGRFIIGTNNSDNNLKIFDNVGYKDTGVVIFDDLDVHHVVVTVDGTSALVYDNGNQVGSATISASHGIDTATDAAIATNIFYSSNNAVTGTLYRCRFYNKALTSAEVQTAYERADVDFIDQYGSQTELVTNGDFTSSSDWTGSDWSIGSGVASIDGSQTGSRKLSQNIGVSAGVRYRITYTISAYTTGQIRFLFASTDGGTYRNAAGTYSEEFVPTSSGSFHLQANASFNGSIDNVSVVRIGCVSDYDLAFANPTQSLTVQDRSGAADGTCSASGVTQVQPVVQGNLTSLAVSNGTAVTPADGQVVIGPGTGGDDPKMIVGGEGNAQLRARHIDGKGSTNSNTGKLFLNHYSASDITMAAGGGNVGINTSSVEAGWSTSCAPIFEISGTKPTLILEEPSVGEFSFVTKNGNLYISDEENNAARLTIDSTGNVNIPNKIRIGTSGTPSEPLHIDTNGVSDIMLSRTTGATSGNLGRIFFGALDGDAHLASVEGYQDGAADAGGLIFSTEATGGSRANRLVIDSTGLATFSGGITVSGGITTLGSFSELTINSGQITITQSVHTVDTESDAATDDLDTINGGSTGSILVLKSVLGSRHVVLKDGTDNLRLNGDCELGTSNDTITLMKVSTVWREMSRSLN